jgi:hypothetical protein
MVVMVSHICFFFFKGGWKSKEKNSNWQDGVRSKKYVSYLPMKGGGRGSGHWWVEPKDGEADWAGVSRGGQSDREGTAEALGGPIAQAGAAEPVLGGQAVLLWLAWPWPGTAWQRQDPMVGPCEKTQSENLPWEESADRTSGTRLTSSSGRDVKHPLSTSTTRDLQVLVSGILKSSLQ